MKRTRNEPQLLLNVMEVIADMKERTGSTQKKIVERILQQLPSTNTSKNMVLKVRRALEYGLQSGLIKHIGGKYSLGLKKHDFAICRKFTDPNSDNNGSKRRRRRGRRRRRRRSRSKRRRSKIRSRYCRPSTEIGVAENTESNKSITDIPEPLDKNRKRRGKRRTRPYGRREGWITINDVDSGTSDVDYKGLKTAFSPKMKYSDQAIAEDGNNWKRNDQERAHDQDDDGEHGNSHCFCNVKLEDGCPRCMSSENMTYYNDSYLN
ncbi:uncharacterized protein [Euwallacea fornicatus]|uniref:uncharacterized protein isoform X1 n=1 Tax=Euwallacea fornicatus TaxID=995702 RepID=UPI00338DF05A